MSKIRFRFLVTCGVAVSMAFVCQLGMAAIPASKSVEGTAPSKAVAGDAARGRLGAPSEKSPEGLLTVLKSGPEHIRVVYHLKYTPVNDANQTVQKLLRLEGELRKPAANVGQGPATPAPGAAAAASVALAPLAVSNSLVISGPPEAVEEVRSLLGKLDQPGGMVLVEAEIGEVPLGEIKPGENPKSAANSPAAKTGPYRLPQRPEKMETIARLRLITMDNQAAFVQMGSRVPRIRSIKPTGDEITSVNVGLILGLTPRINSDGVVMEIDVEKSDVATEGEGIPISAVGDKVIRSPRINTTQVQTTITIANGQTMILAGVAEKGKSDKELVILLTPHIVGVEEAKKKE